MATLHSSQRFLILFSVSLLCIISQTTAINDLETLFPSSQPLPTPPPQSQQHLQHEPAFSSPPPTTMPDLNDQSFFSHTALLAPILSHLGYNELATAAPSLSMMEAGTWSGPSTLFAPSDSSIRTCISCSIPSLLREHMVPGLFTTEYLRKLAFGTKIETLSPGRCVTITSSKHLNDTVPKIFIGGVEVTNPDLFNNGLVIIHGIEGFISPLSPLSCDVERMSSVSFPFQPSDRPLNHHQIIQNQPSIMRWMLRDAMLRLRNNGFSILSLAFKVKYPELISLNNMTVFALDDVSIFSGSYSYISNIRFHIVPNRYLTIVDLERLPVGTTLPTLVRGQSLVVTTAGGGGLTVPMRINYVGVNPDVMRNLKIIIHGVYLPFPHINPASADYKRVMGGVGGGSNVAEQMMEGACSVMDEQLGSCGPPPLVSRINNKPTVDIEDHHML